MVLSTPMHIKGETRFKLQPFFLFVTCVGVHCPSTSHLQQSLLVICGWGPDTGYCGDTEVTCLVYCSTHLCWCGCLTQHFTVVCILREWHTVCKVGDHDRCMQLSSLWCPFCLLGWGLHCPCSASSSVAIAELLLLVCGRGSKEQNLWRALHNKR